MGTMEKIGKEKMEKHPETKLIDDIKSNQIQGDLVSSWNVSKLINGLGSMSYFFNFMCQMENYHVNFIKVLIF